MIQIQQISGDLLNGEYELLLNGKRVSTFTHHRPDDIAVELIKAAQSVAKGRWKNTLDIYSKYGG